MTEPFKYSRTKMVECTPLCLPRHSYSVYDAKWGGLEFWYLKSESKLAKEIGEDFFGGVEHHMKAPPDYMEEKEASQEFCKVAMGKCWHDGSSLAFDRYKQFIGNDDAIFTKLEGELAGILSEDSSE